MIRTRKRQYTAGFFFCGSGGGALGFLQAETHLLGCEGSFRSVGGIDNDAQCCADFEYLTQSPALCADMAAVTPAQLRRFMGPKAPDVVFGSAPCKGSSGLLSEAKARTPKYEELNRLTLLWMQLLLSAWNPPPKLILIENVPRITSRARQMLADVRSMLRGAGYLLHEGFHCCGELGGLAQRRKRFLLVARHPSRVPPLLYQPPRKRVRGVGEVIGPLPMPEDAGGGPMHTLPRLSWLNWVRLALIPAGGDWRDLPKDVDLPIKNPARHWEKYGVKGWCDPVGTITGATRPGCGSPAVADPRGRQWYDGALGVTHWDAASGTITGKPTPTNGKFAIADERARKWFGGTMGVLDWQDSAATITAQARPSTGPFSVADVRIGCNPRERSHAYGVIGWEDAAATITGSACIDNGPFAISDPRKAPPFIPVIVAADGTWHRPLTTLELAMLQGLPLMVRGKVLCLAGKSSSSWRERIGNMVPAPAARAIAEAMLITLIQADAESFTLCGGQDVWVHPAGRMQ